MQLVLFDVDGTLIDSHATIHECMRRTFAAFDHAEPSPDAVRAIIGLSLETAIANLLGRDSEQVVAMTSHYKRDWLAMQAEPEFSSPFFPGMRQLLTVLSERDEVALGIVTGKSRRGIAGIIASHSLERTFLTTRTADDCPSKPHPAMVLECCAETGIEPAATTVIGDTGFDMEMACAAGARAIGVGWGYHSREDLTSSGAVAIAEDADAILALVEPGSSVRLHDARIP